MFRPFRRQEGDEGGSGGAAAQDSAAGAAVTPPPALDLTPDAVRRSPEYLESQRQLHAARSEAGRNRSLAEQARAEAEQARQAAEAERVNAQHESIRQILGDDGVAEWEAIAELSGSDPVKAAERFRDFGSRMAQSQQPPAVQTPPVAPQLPPAGGTQVPQFPSSGALGGNAPLGQATAESGWDPIVERATKDFNDVVERVQNPDTRNRVTQRDRAKGMMGFLEGSYAQAFKERGYRTR